MYSCFYSPSLDQSVMLHNAVPVAIKFSRDRVWYEISETQKRKFLDDYLAAPMWWKSVKLQDPLHGERVFPCPNRPAKTHASV